MNHRKRSILMTAVVLLATGTRMAAAQEKLLYSFPASSTDGQAPYAGLVADGKGNFYGTTSAGGVNSKGTVFELSPGPGGTWTEKVLYSFGVSSTDGTTPYSSVIFDAGGNLYGTTRVGGQYRAGTVFELSPGTDGTWTENLIYSFTGGENGDGATPLGSLIFDNQGNLYGTTAQGADGGGIVFELTPVTGGGWSEQVLYIFPPEEGGPEASLIFDSSGNLYGTASNGGPNASGTVFELTSGAGGIWTEQVLYTFGASSTDGTMPFGSLIFNGNNLYGTTMLGGASGNGTVFELIPSAGGAWTENILYNFGSVGNDGANPQGDLIFDATGNLYGTTSAGGSYSFRGTAGTVFELSPGTGGTWIEKVLYNFWATPTDAHLPTGNLLSDASGNLYGTTTAGGPNGAGTVYEITSSATPTGSLQFVPVTPCRVVDTRNPSGPFGGPELAAATSREFDVPNSSCGIPSTAVAYSLNVTVVPNASLNYLTLWPSGQPQPFVSTLNSDGRVKANAAITPAGSNGGVSVFVSDASQVILDIDGYFVPAGSTASALAFYPVTPCRVADTRNAAGPLGAPFLSGNTSRSFPVQSSSCGLPSTAQAYSLNVTAVPHSTLNYLTTWPTGETQPYVSTLNSSTGAVTANAAIVPAGNGGDVSVFVYNDADVILDVNGYFAPPATGGLSLYTVTPCRAIDTRPNAFNGILTVGVEPGACGPPSTAQAYVLNATVVPVGALNYLTLWPDGASQPYVSTLNADDGAITSNVAIVPTNNGLIDAFADGTTNLILDISSYFAP